jgi:tetratricopeptide (TPR) repeat protein
MNVRLFLILLFSISIIYSCKEKKNELNHQTIEDYWLEQIKLHPDSVLLKESLIQLYRDSLDYEAAVFYCDSLVKVEGDNPRWWHIKGTLHFELHDTVTAIKSFSKAYMLNPNPIDGIYWGRILAFQSDSSCLILCNELLQKFGKNIEKETFLIKGDFFTSKKNYDKALLNYDSSMNASYTFMEAYLQKATLLMQLEKFEAAIVVLKKATTIQNNYDEGFFNLGKCYERIKDTTAAIEAYNRTLLINPDYTEAINTIDALNN